MPIFVKGQLIYGQALLVLSVKVIGLQVITTGLQTVKGVS